MILITGGTGLLGTEIQKHLKCFSPKRSDGWCIEKNWRSVYAFKNQLKNIELIIHCAAFTDLVLAERDRKLCYLTNVIGTRNLASLGIPMLYISTEYVFDGTKGDYSEEDYPNPQNFYALTKLLGEYESRRTKSVVIRCLFKPRPFEHPSVCNDMFTSGDYVDRIAEEIALAAKKFDRLPPTLHIGTGKKRLLDLARRTRDCSETTTEEIYQRVRVILPKDTSLNTLLWEKIKHEN